MNICAIFDHGKMLASMAQTIEHNPWDTCLLDLRGLGGAPRGRRWRVDDGDAGVVDVEGGRGRCAVRGGKEDDERGDGKRREEGRTR